MRRFTVFVITLVALLPAAGQQPVEITPDQLWTALVNGNKQFVTGKVAYDDLKAERENFKDHQLPPITVLSCSDSRVPPELVFNQSLGTLFVIRTAGNVADDFGIGSIEFAIQQGYTRLIVILGHDSCGAVKAALGGADPDTPSLAAVAKRIRSSFVGVPYDSRDAANVNRAVEANARASAAQLLANSRVIRDAVLTQQVKIVTANYNLETGEVKALN
jgi:carbonic anhydrase